MQWQNELLQFRDSEGKSYTATYLRTIQNQLNAIMNHASKYYWVKRRELVSYYKACESYLTNDMRIAIRNEDVKGFSALVSRLTASNPDGTVARRDPGWEELFDFEIKFGEYLEMKNKNVKTEDILKELNKPELHNRMKR